MHAARYPTWNGDYMNQVRSERLPWEAGFTASIANARVSKNLSFEELARRIREFGVLAHAHTVEEIESGARSITLTEALVICKVLELELPDVLIPVRADLVNQSFEKDIDNAETDWGKIAERFAQVRLDVTKTLQHLLYLRSSYSEAIDRAGGESRHELVSKLDTLTGRVRAVHNGLAAADRDLSKPPPAALSPGSQS